MFESLFGKSFQPDQDIPDLSGKVILVTGGNAGLGKETITQLARHNPKEIFLAARSQSKAEDAIASIKHANPNARLTFLELDLSSFSSIAAAAKTFTSRSDRLDILLNNAGIMNVPYSTTKDGYEIQLGTNHMGHALLTKLLLPTLLRTAEESGSDVRIVNLASGGHMFGLFSGGVITDQSKAESYSSFVRYGSVKLANILHARALKERYPQLTVTALHPGVIDTNLFTATWGNMDKIPVLGWVTKLYRKLFMSTVQQGARNQLWCCTARKEEVRKGYYFTPVGKRDKGIGKARSEEETERVWQWTEAELKKHGY